MAILTASVKIILSDDKIIFPFHTHGTQMNRHQHPVLHFVDEYFRQTTIFLLVQRLEAVILKAYLKLKISSQFSALSFATCMILLPLFGILLNRIDQVIVDQVIDRTSGDEIVSTEL